MSNTPRRVIWRIIAGSPRAKLRAEFRLRQDAWVAVGHQICLQTGLTALAKHHPAALGQRVKEVTDIFAKTTVAFALIKEKAQKAEVPSFIALPVGNPDDNNWRMETPAEAFARICAAGLEHRTFKHTAAEWPAEGAKIKIETAKWPREEFSTPAWSAAKNNKERYDRAQKLLWPAAPYAEGSVEFTLYGMMSTILAKVKPYEMLTLAWTLNPPDPEKMAKYPVVKGERETWWLHLNKLLAEFWKESCKQGKYCRQNREQDNIAASMSTDGLVFLAIKMDRETGIVETTRQAALRLFMGMKHHPNADIKNPEVIKDLRARMTEVGLFAVEDSEGALEDQEEDEGSEDEPVGDESGKVKPGEDNALGNPDPNPGS